MTELPTMELPTHLMKPGVMYRVVHTGGHPELRVGDQVYVASRAGNVNFSIAVVDVKYTTVNTFDLFPDTGDRKSVV